MSQTDSRALVERARRGERAAFDELVAKHRSHLEAVIIRRLGHTLRARLTVEDVLQDTLVRAFGSIERFEWRRDDGGRTSSFFRWLSGIAVRVILEHARRYRREAPLSLDFDLASHGEVSPSRELVRRERREQFEAALERLSSDHRTVLRLVRLEGLPLREVARRMDRSPNAVSQLVLRALRSLRRELGEWSQAESLRFPRDHRGASDADGVDEHD